MLLQYFELVFVQLQLVKFSRKLIIISVNYERKKKGSFLMKHRVYLLNAHNLSYVNGRTTDILNFSFVVCLSVRLILSNRNRKPCWTDRNWDTHGVCVRWRVAIMCLTWSVAGGQQLYAYRLWCCHYRSRYSITGIDHRKSVTITTAVIGLHV